jgi:aryl-alcohol dehydrogenase-like predicted oxidoreductase
VITGAKRVEQLASNVKAADWNLTVEQLKELDGMLTN